MIKTAEIEPSEFEKLQTSLKGKKKRNQDREKVNQQVSVFHAICCLKVLSYTFF